MLKAIGLGFAGIVILAVVTLLSRTLLILFAGILVALVLDAAVSALCRLLRLPRPLALILTVLTILLAIGAGLVAGGVALVAQAQSFFGGLGVQIEAVARWLRGLGIDVENLERMRFLDMLPEPITILGRAGDVFGLTTSTLSDLLIVALMGIFIAVSPGMYRDGILTLVPLRHRPRLGEVLNLTGSILQRWLVSQLILMALVAVSVSTYLWVVGAPYALLLGLIAGLLNFIPFLGPILSGVPILLTVLQEDWSTIAIVFGGFLVIQWVEGYLVAPFIQHRIVHLAPAISLAFLAAMAALFGGLGVALATPLLAVVRVMTIELYIRDVLGDPNARVAGGHGRASGKPKPPAGAAPVDAGGRTGEVLAPLGSP